LIYVGVLLLPFCIGLYNQHGSYGLKFYFWTQSFGRITGESTWKNDSNYLFFVHTFVWSFLPWAFLAVFAIITNLKALIKGSNNFKIVEALTLVGTLIPFFVLSLSKYKLPHYIFVLFPLLSILTASSIYNLIKGYYFWKKVLIGIQLVTILVLWIIGYVLMIFVFPCSRIDIWTVVILANLLTVYFILRIDPDWSRLVISPAITIIAVNFILNAHFYPNLLQYQAGKTMAKSELDINREIFAFKVSAYSFDFYSNRIVNFSDETTISKIKEQKKQVYIITGKVGLDYLKSIGAEINDLKSFNNYPITRLTLKFLKPSTRPGTLRQYHLVKVN